MDEKIKTKSFLLPYRGLENDFSGMIWLETKLRSYAISPETSLQL